ncbi:MAG: hypothetical protein RIS75_1238 [Actinomycetota bacterium]
MNNSFDTTVWVVQSILILCGILAITPVLRAVAGLSMIAVAHMIGKRDSRLYAHGVRTLPPFLRTALGVTTALSLTGVMMAQPAMADEVPVIDRVISVTQPDPVAEAQQITRDSTSAPTPSDISPVQSTNEKVSYVVKSGDSLWKIAHEFLAQDNATVTSSMIDEKWRTIWSANRDVIGSDPSRIQPGQILWLENESRPTR